MSDFSPADFSSADLSGANLPGDKPLDLKGLKCPLPALRTRKALRRVPPGGLLVVECTDPMSVIDIPHLVNETGDRLERNARTDDVYVFHIRRAAGDRN